MKGIVSGGGRPMSNTAVILRTVSSACVGTSVSGMSKAFILSDRPRRCHLVIRRLLCEAGRVRKGNESINIVRLSPRSCTLSRIIMGTRHPFIGIRRKHLKCSLSILTNSKIIGGTCRTLAGLPNMGRAGNMLALTNAKGLAIILGKGPAAVSTKRLRALLHGAPLSEIRGTRIVCDTPPRCRMEWFK